MLAEVAKISFTIKHELSLGLRLVGGGEELIVASEYGYKEGEEGVEETVFLQDSTTDGDLLGIARCDECDISMVL